MTDDPSPSRMFKSITRTANPVVGCEHDCIYCWARDQALGRLKNTPKYKDGFKPAFFPEVLKQKCHPGEFILVSDMGDLFGEWVPKEWIDEVLDWVGRYPFTSFLLLTKNPGRFKEFVIPLNAYLGTTIETNRDYLVSKAPSTFDRYLAMTMVAFSTSSANLLTYHRKFLAIEPIMDFDLASLSHWIRRINPNIIEIGADNHHYHLVEPPGWKVRDLIEDLQNTGYEVIEKPGLERLKEKLKG